MVQTLIWIGPTISQMVTNLAQDSDMLKRSYLIRKRTQLHELDEILYSDTAEIQKKFINPKVSDILRINSFLLDLQI